jgi:hypothetical protein
VGFDSKIGIVFYKMCITTYEVTVSVASVVLDKEMPVALCVAVKVESPVERNNTILPYTSATAGVSLI